MNFVLSVACIYVRCSVYVITRELTQQVIVYLLSAVYRYMYFQHTNYASLGKHDLLT